MLNTLRFLFRWDRLTTEAMIVPCKFRTHLERASEYNHLITMSILNARCLCQTLVTEWHNRKGWGYCYTSSVERRVRLREVKITDVLLYMLIKKTTSASQHYQNVLMTFLVVKTTVARVEHLKEQVANVAEVEPGDEELCLLLNYHETKLTKTQMNLHKYCLLPSMLVLCVAFITKALHSTSTLL